MSPDKSDDALLLKLELQLMDPEFRRDRDRVGALLAEEFNEFGSSGRVWNRAAILDFLADEPGYVAPAVEDFTVTVIASAARLVTYATVRASQRTLRSSIWVWRSGAWLLLFHQGTRAPQES